nr:hypothetical protein [Ktedonobacter sp. SOSP1-52]
MTIPHSDMEHTGWFECSEPMLNQLHENVIWSMRGNFLDVPTDCPQRDERLGWTGDLQVFSPTATFLYNCAGFPLADLAADQREVGVVPFVVPDILHCAGGSAGGAAVWSHAAVIVPWVLCQRFGDTGILAQQFESMRSWVDVMAERAGPGQLFSNRSHSPLPSRGAKSPQVHPPFSERRSSSQMSGMRCWVRCSSAQKLSKMMDIQIQHMPDPGPFPGGNAWVFSPTGSR